MEREKELKLIEQLKNAKLKTYTVDSFKKYWTYEDDYQEKKARVVNATYIAVYSTYKNRLLARVFYLEERMKYKKITRKLFEVQRQLAGVSIKISKRIFNCTFYGLKVYTHDNANDRWIVGNAVKTQLFALYDNWSGMQVVGFEQYNDPIKFLKKSIHKYSGFEYLPVEKQEHNYMFEYLLKYEKHPQIEMLAKLGLSHIVDNLIGIRWSKKGPAMLGVTKEEIPYLREMDLLSYRSIRNECLKYKFSVKEAKVLLEFNEMKTDKLTFSARLIRYLSAKDIRIYDYADHMRMKQELNLPDEKKYLYPDNFQEEHEKLSRQLKIKESEELRLKMENRRDELEKLSIKKNGFYIFPLLSPNELYDEGKLMDHCVGGYTEKVANGTCAIFSVRKLEDISKPLTTIELQGKKVIQVRAYKNKYPSEDIVNFVRSWERQFRLKGF